jgi:hypothetical protein
VVAGLRRWAEGAATDEAAVELLIGLGARFTDPRCSWIRRCPRAGWYWLDPDSLSVLTGRLTTHERRVLTLVVALLFGEPATTLSRVPNVQVVSGRAAA